MAITALIISIVAAVGTAAAGIFAGLAWRQAKRQADATRESAREAKRSADAAEQSSNIASDMKDITLKEQELSSDRWQAANKPWIRITFADFIIQQRISGRDPFALHEKTKTGAPQLICIENIGRLPCRLIECWLDDETKINPNLVQSSIATHRMAGFLEGAAIAHDEAQTFQSPEIPRITKAHEPGIRFPFKLIYEYEPDMQVTLSYSAVAETPVEEGANWVNLVLIESTRDYREQKRS